MCPLLCCQWPLEGASPGLQVDCCDICGSAGLAGPLTAGAPGGFGSWAGGGLGGFPEALPECSFNLLLTGPQAVLGTQKNSEVGLLGGMEEGPLRAKGPLASPIPSGSRCRERTPPSTQGSWEVRPQPSPRNQPSILRNWQEDVATGCESSPASDTKPPAPTPAYHLAEKGTQGWCPSTHPRPLALLQTKAGDKRPQKPQVRTHETRRGDQV